MAKSKITIVGLGLIGNSIGLGLAQSQRSFEIVGHDKENSAAGQARKLKAVDRTEWNLISACDGADLIVLALPAAAIKDTFKALAGNLKPGAVLLDTASIKAPVQAWADELLPQGVSYIGTNPIVSSDQAGGAAARGDLFQGTIWAICPSPTTDERAVKMAIDLAERLGAAPLFLEVAEHDGMMAEVEHLPAVVSMAVLTSVVSLPTWRETRKLAGGQFESTTRLTSDDPAVFSDAVLANREQVIRRIDAFVDSMAGWRALIAAGDEEALAKAFETAIDARARWLWERRTGNWEEGRTQDASSPGTLSTMFGFGRRERKAQDKARK